MSGMNPQTLRAWLHVNPASVRPAPSVADQPEVVLLQWRVVRLPGGGCVLVGFLEGSSVIRVTTHIVRSKGREVWTRSGRCYALPYGPATDDEVVALLCERLAANGDFVYIDVTDSFAETLQTT